MTDIRTTMNQLVEEACALHKREKGITLESVILVGRLDQMNAAVNLGISSEALAKRVGLTPDMFWKRAQAARVLLFFPEALDMLKAGEIEVSHLAAVAGKITEANSEILLSGIRNKTKREVEALVSVVTLDGRLLEKEPEVEVRVMLTISEMKLIDRAREVLAARGHVPKTRDIVVKAIGDLLNKRDPMVKAKEAEARKAAALGQRAKKESAAKSDGSNEPSLDSTGAIDLISESPDQVSSNGSEVPAPGQASNSGSEAPAPGQRGQRRAIRSAVKHAVMLRDGGQCTETLADGSRCPEKLMLEFDHVELKCRGSDDRVEDLTLKCRRHNRAAAERELGPGYMVSWETSRGVPSAKEEHRGLSS